LREVDIGVAGACTCNDTAPLVAEGVTEHVITAITAIVDVGGGICAPKHVSPEDASG
jgi:hypothetical protein